MAVNIYSYITDREIQMYRGVVLQTDAEMSIE